MQALEPGVQAVKDFLKTDRSSNDIKEQNKPIVLVHAFSNGGSHSAIQLAQAYRESIRSFSADSFPLSLPPKLPISALMLDSCPGRPEFMLGVQIIMSFIPPASTILRAVARPFAYALVTGVAALHELGIAEPISDKLWRELNSPAGAFLVGNHDAAASMSSVGSYTSGRFIPRTYIFSKKDNMVPERNVLEHALEARRMTRLNDAQARDVIRLEEFVGSMHVNHVSMDRERYWALVKETVERSVSA